MEPDKNWEKKKPIWDVVGGFLVWMFETSAVFVIYLCPVVYFGAFDGKRPIYTAESWLTEAELISVHACLFMHTGREKWLRKSESHKPDQTLNTSMTASIPVCQQQIWHAHQWAEREMKTHSDEAEIGLDSLLILSLLGPSLSSNRVSTNN